LEELPENSGNKREGQQEVFRNLYHTAQVEFLYVNGHDVMFRAVREPAYQVLQRDMVEFWVNGRCELPDIEVPQFWVTPCIIICTIIRVPACMLKSALKRYAG
jgi:hypothetical protein